MSTIVYKAGIIAYDSQLTSGEVITDLNFDKHFIKDGCHFFMAGTTWLYPKFIESFLAGKNLIKLIDEEIDPSVGALIIDKDGLIFECGIDEEKVFHKSEVKRDTISAIGSGRPFAFTAMDMGASAKEAVAMAAKRDLFTGGIIRTFKLPKFKEESKESKESNENDPVK